MAEGGKRAWRGKEGLGKWEREGKRDWRGGKGGKRANKRS